MASYVSLHKFVFLFQGYFSSQRLMAVWMYGTYWTGDYRLTSIFSLGFQYIVKRTGGENCENRQLEDNVLMYDQILITKIIVKKYINQWGEFTF